MIISKKFNFKKFAFLILPNMIISFLIAMTLAYYWMLIINENQWTAPIVISSLALEIFSFILLTILSIFICSETTKNTFVLWIKNHLMQSIFITILALFCISSYRKEMIVKEEVARSYVSMEWTIFAIIFAFSFMMTTLISNKLTNVNVTLSNKKEDILKSLMERKNRREIKSILKIAFPNVIYIGLNFLLLIIATYLIYPTSSFSYNTIGQFFVIISMHCTILNFMMVSINIFGSLNSLKKQLDRANKELSEYEDLNYKIYKNQLILNNDKSTEENKSKALKNIECAQNNLNLLLASELAIVELFDDDFNFKGKDKTQLGENTNE